MTNARIRQSAAAATPASGGEDVSREIIRFAPGRDRGDSGWLRAVGVPATHVRVAALACLAVGAGCSGGSLDTSAIDPAPAVTLAWDQPDGRAEYYLVKTGPLLLRTEQPSIRLQLTAAPHAIDITSCNATGCSRPASVVIDWRDGGWALLAPNQDDTVPAGSRSEANTSDPSGGTRRQRPGIPGRRRPVPDDPPR